MPNGPQKIILIRAGRYDYAEVDLTATLQIVGPNNTGKTTLINTLQFLYVDDLRTMDFGSYNLEQTLAYYFPNQYSYVLFECLGSTGTCVIGWRGQSKAAGGDPERFCYLGAFAAQDFLSEHQVREPRDVSSRLALKQFRVIKSAQEHRETLLPPDSPDGKGLGIVALRDPDRFRRFRESLKDLLSLSTITQEQMRERLLTLAEVRTDLPALDVRKVFGDDYDVIRRRREALARFKKHEVQIRELVDKETELERIRGQLIAWWAPLRQQSLLFQQSHEKTLVDLRARIDTLTTTLADLGQQLNTRSTERDACLAEKGALSGRLAEIERQAKAFAQFDPDFAHAAEQNLKNEELRLKNLLAEAAVDSREKAQQKVALYEDLVRHKQEMIANFDRLAVTALRRHFDDGCLGKAFRLLNFDLLQTPVGTDGISVRNEKALLGLIQDLAEKVRDGAYVDERVRIAFRREELHSVAELADVNALREKLEEEAATLRRCETILKAILERQQLASQLKRTQDELAVVQRQLVLHDSYLQARADEPRWRRELKAVDDCIGRLDAILVDLAGKQDAAKSERQHAQNSIVREEDSFNAVMGRFDQCAFPDYTAKPAEIESLPDDFDLAISAFLKRQDRQNLLGGEVFAALKLVAQLVGESYNGADDVETIRNLAAELEAFPLKTQALERDWNALIQGLRGLFAGVLKELDAVRSAVTDLNRQFGRVQVSNLKAIKLEVLDAGDLVSWIKRLVNLEQPGLFDDDTQLDQTLRNFRQRLEGSPLISFAQLFSLQFTVVGEDGVAHHYQDFRQIESHGTTITIKVLFNLLVLRRYLREDQCVVPFFLDEIQALDPANRAAVLSTSRKLGFLAITASPEPVTEVDSLYFLQPQQGRIVLRERHRVGVKLPGFKV
jgi:hypothetical protein